MCGGGFHNIILYGSDLNVCILSFEAVAIIDAGVEVHTCPTGTQYGFVLPRTGD